MGYKDNSFIRFLVWPLALFLCAPRWVRVCLVLLVVSTVLAVVYDDKACVSGHGEGVHPYVPDNRVQLHPYVQGELCLLKDKDD